MIRVNLNGVVDSRSDQHQYNATNAANERSLCVTTSGSPTKSRAYVDHTYHDFSRYLKEGGVTVAHKKSSANFPAKLNLILSNHEFSHIIAWMPHGRAWKILDKELLTTTVIPAHFAQTKFHSFTRQLNSWNFKRLHQKGPDFGCYYHENFLSGLPELTVLMVRSTSKQGKRLPFAKGEPNFYRISKIYPLPPLPMKVFDQNSSSLILTKPTEPRAVMMPASHLIPHHHDMPTFDVSSTPSPTTASPAHVDSSTRYSMTADTMSSGMPIKPRVRTTSSTSAVAPFEKLKCVSSHRVPTTINAQNLSTGRAAQEPPRSSARARDSLTSVSAITRAPAQSAQTLNPPSHSCHTQSVTDPILYVLSAVMASSSHRSYGGDTDQTQPARDPQQENHRVQNNDSQHRSLSTSIATSYSNHQHHDGQRQPASMFHQQGSSTLNPEKRDHSGSPDGPYEGESDFDDDMLSFLKKNGL